MTTSSVPIRKTADVLSLFDDDDDADVRRTLRRHGNDLARLKDMVMQLRAPAEVIHPRAGQAVSETRNRVGHALALMEGAIDGDYVNFDASKLLLKQELAAVCKELEAGSSPGRHLASLLYDAVRWTRTSQVTRAMIEAMRECLGFVYGPWLESAFANGRRRLLRAGWLVSPPGDLEENCIP